MTSFHFITHHTIEIMDVSRDEGKSINMVPKRLLNFYIIHHYLLTRCNPLSMSTYSSQMRLVMTSFHCIIHHMIENMDVDQDEGKSINTVRKNHLNSNIMNPCVLDNVCNCMSTLKE